MTTRTTMTLDMPDDLMASELANAMREISQAVDEGDDEGDVEVAGQRILWRIEIPGVGVEIDRRQRVAAAMLLMGFDLPQDAISAARTMIEASRVCSGMTTGDMAPMGAQGRREALEAVRKLVDEMLSEIGR